MVLRSNGIFLFCANFSSYLRGNRGLSF